MVERDCAALVLDRLGSDHFIRFVRVQKGSCGFGYQWPDVGTGFDVAAIADAAPEFGGSCGCADWECGAGVDTIW